MDFNEFKDRLFDAINEADNLPIKDVDLRDREDSLLVELKDGSKFKVLIEKMEDKV